MKNKLNQPDVEVTTATTGDSISLNITIPSKQFTDIFKKQTTIQEHKPTFEEVKQEWEELGYELIRHERRELIFKSKKGETIFTIWNFNDICYSKKWKGKPANISLQEHNLLTRTFKALEWEG